MKKFLISLALSLGLAAVVTPALQAQPIVTTYWNGLRWDTGPTAPTVCYEPGWYYQTSGTAQLMFCDVKADGFVAVPKAVSGTFTTPNLGTPSAINLANATNLPSSAQPVIKVVDTNITTASLATEAICALHTDSGCNNSATDATAANCPAGTLTAACTLPISITTPANSLASTTATLTFSVGKLGTATVPTALFEIYLDSVRVYAGTATTLGTGSTVATVSCSLAGLSSTTSAPVVVSCSGTGAFGTSAFAVNSLLSNSTPAIAIDATISHSLKLSVAFSANTTGNLVWLNAIRYSY